VTIRTCLCLITRPAGDGSPASLGVEVLLGYKKNGFGAGKWVGLGGHVEDGEEFVDAAVREVEEESSLVVKAADLAHMATLSFVFPSRPSWDQTADVFVTGIFAGEPAESDELIPRWFAAGELPFGGMWDDAKYWLPAVLSGEQVTAVITFADDCATVRSIDPPLPAPRLRRDRSGV
jgi:8-oxo-dGTP diphosphatase